MADDGFIARSLRPDVVAAALPGLLAAPKTLPPKLFYDQEGSRLFRCITELPEYYLTRTEREMLRTLVAKVTADLPAGTALVEYGASDESKAEFLLRARNRAGASVFTAYVPIDVAAEELEQAQRRLTKSFPGLSVHVLATDFLLPVTLPGAVSGMPRLGFFPGSTIGNLDPAEAQTFLTRMRETLGADARLLIGVDLVKDPAILVPAYDDEAGVTAAFNLNVLARLNREGGADFDLNAFTHKAVWNSAQSRMEMHLISRHVQVVHIAGQAIRFADGETIHTENSYKYTTAGFIALAGRSAWRSVQVWTDDKDQFSIHFLEAV